MHNRVTVAVALAAGFVGGMLPRYISPSAVSAQTQAPPELRARSFALVDPTDHVVGTFVTEPSRPGKIWEGEGVVIPRHVALARLIRPRGLAG